ncbi:MAG: Uma2 family endonuclease [Hormoscilla sp. GUM202]|nr:Uma2 family endonuclease [Hormoscilla sp. GUM202]
MVTSTIVSKESEVITLDDYMRNPPDMEWVDGQLLEKNGMTTKHGRIQGNLYFHWRNYKVSSGQGGQVYVDAPCRTVERGRKPDVAYLTSELLEQFGEPAVFPQSFPLIGEIISPTDPLTQLRQLSVSLLFLLHAGLPIFLLFLLLSHT